MARLLPLPPTRLLGLMMALSVGAVIGVGVFTFGYARGASYLTNDPAACNNCHVMNAHFAGWQKSSHRNVATCNDCHTPHDFAGKYLSKASNGFWHSVGFTTGRYPDPLRIEEHNLKIAENACRECHGALVAPMTGGEAHAGTHAGTYAGATAEPLPFCTRCHYSVGHRVR